MYNRIDVKQLPESLTHRIRDVVYDMAENYVKNSHETSDTPNLYTLSFKLNIAAGVSLSGLQTKPPFYYWARPERSYYKMGLGRAWQFETRGACRFEELQAAYQELTHGWHHQSLEYHDAGTDGGTEAASAPEIFCAFAFDEYDTMENCWQEFPNSLLTLPAVMIQIQGDQYTFNFSAKSEILSKHPEEILNEWFTYTGTLLQQLCSSAEKTNIKQDLYLELSEPEDTDWLSLVNKACHAIHEGEFTKVVPARHLRLRGKYLFETGKILQQLNETYPSCVQLACCFSEATLIAATPEQLISKQGHEIKCDALGGTIQKSLNVERDQQLAKELMQASKTRREHALVVDHVARALVDICSEMDVPRTPSIMSLPRLQHLLTAITAKAGPNVTVFDLLQRLHPTPAVGGTPSKNALQWLKDNESFNRGWYTGGIGWLDFDGNGEFAVVLRCALLKSDQADVYAGAGVVADSNAGEELAETELKLSGLINILMDNEQAPEMQSSCAIQQ
ncbi:MAG: isochorismate synthase [Gammaproteobacteria bacterium]|nr:isochorismate synthase [Gammaproteobacteria bacterium]